MYLWLRGFECLNVVQRFWKGVHEAGVPWRKVLCRRLDGAKVKGKFTAHTMTVCGLEELDLHSPLNLALARGECQIHASVALLLAKSRRYPLIRGLHGPQGQSGRFVDEINFITPPDFLIVRPVAQLLYRLRYPGCLVGRCFFRGRGL